MADYKQEYFEKMKPYAQRASSALGIPVSVILAQWAHESAYGTSYGATHRNNHAGISNFTGTPYSWSKAIKVEPRPSSEGAWYNVYRTIDDFVEDYIHVMNLSYYDKVREAGKTEGIDDDILELGKSPFAANGYVRNGVKGQAIRDMITANDLIDYDDGKSLSNIIKNPNEAIINDDLKLAIFTGAAFLGIKKLLS